LSHCRSCTGRTTASKARCYCMPCAHNWRESGRQQAGTVQIWLPTRCRMPGS
jgi:hypothetical protein